MMPEPVQKFKNVFMQKCTHKLSITFKMAHFVVSIEGMV